MATPTPGSKVIVYEPSVDLGEKGSTLANGRTAVYTVEELAEVNEPLVYIAALSQSGEDDPVATVIKNTLGGELVWARGISAGNYTATLVGAFATGEIQIILPINGWDFTQSLISNVYGAGKNDNDSIYLTTGEVTNSTGVTANADGCLFGSGYSVIEIRVYN